MRHENIRTTRSDPYGTWRQAWRIMDQHERRTALGVLVVTVVSALSSAVMVVSILPFLAVLSDPGRIRATPAFQRAYDLFGFSSDYGFLVALGFVSLAVIVLTSVLQMLKVYVITRFAQMQIHRISCRLMGIFLRQPYEFFLDSHSGEMNKSILAESSQVVSQFYRPLAELVAALLSALAILGVVLWVDPVITLAALILLGGAYGGIYVLVRGQLRRLGQERVRHNSGRFRISGEALGGVKDIKLLGREGSYLDRYAAPSEAMAQNQTRGAVISVLPQFVVQSVAFGGIIVLCLTLVDREGYESGAALRGLLPVIGVFAFAGQRLLPELGKIYNALSKLQYGFGAIEAIARDFSLQTTARPLPETPPAALGLRQALVLDGVGYTYPNAEGAGVRDVSVEIRRGERIGVVGSTGAGKTTLADIVLGLLEPQSGEMRADGTPVTSGTLRAWQQSVGYVPQDIFLTDASITENIALGVPPGEIDRDRVIRCAQLAQLHEFIITELPAGYDTTVGERGVRLSGGQRQRIGIARALYHDADLIVFDEATSALDNLTERDVMEAIAALPGDKTILMIAHRLSTVRECDRIIVMERGRLAGFDGWDRLMQDNAAFRRIVEARPDRGANEAAKGADG